MSRGSRRGIGITALALLCVTIIEIVEYGVLSRPGTGIGWFLAIAAILITATASVGAFARYWRWHGE